VREAYLQHLLTPGGLTLDEANAIVESRTNYLEQELEQARQQDYQPPAAPKTSGLPWRDFLGGPDKDVADVETGVPLARLAQLLERSTHVPPEGFNAFTKLLRLYEQRRAMAAGERPLDWGAAETLAFATLVSEGHPIRLSGQDSGRGTFSHRHAAIRDVDDEERYLPLQHLGDGQASFEVWDSPLSEAAVLGFDYGYSLDEPNGLVAWEAQFGDFANAAQVIIDQFISSAEDKWDLLSGLVLLLPHGFEGQGPEHSSARLERFLQMCAEDNMQVVYPTTPAQIFHCLRRQVKRSWRKPLVVMSPKSLLRHPEAKSTLEELASGAFQRVIPDADADPDEAVRRILLCSGRVFYDLRDFRVNRKRQELYPFPEVQLRAALAPYTSGGRAAEGCEVVWVQEEPRNMGAWYYLRALFGETVWGLMPLRCEARDESASPATGSPASHRREQEFLITRAFHSQ